MASTLQVSLEVSVFFYFSAFSRAFSGVMQRYETASKLMIRTPNVVVVTHLHNPWSPTLAFVSSGASPTAPSLDVYMPGLLSDNLPPPWNI